MADWRNFKASIQECLEEANPPQDELREHVVEQLPQLVREFVLREEIAASRKKYMVKVRPPVTSTVRRCWTLWGAKLG